MAKQTRVRRPVAEVISEATKNMTAKEVKEAEEISSGASSRAVLEIALLCYKRDHPSVKLKLGEVAGHLTGKDKDLFEALLAKAASAKHKSA